MGKNKSIQKKKRKRKKKKQRRKLVDRGNGTMYVDIKIFFHALERNFQFNRCFLNPVDTVSRVLFSR